MAAYCCHRSCMRTRCWDWRRGRTTCHAMWVWLSSRKSWPSSTPPPWSPSTASASSSHSGLAGINLPKVWIDVFFYSSKSQLNQSFRISLTFRSQHRIYVFYSSKSQLDQSFSISLTYRSQHRIYVFYSSKSQLDQSFSISLTYRSQHRIYVFYSSRSQLDQSFRISLTLRSQHDQFLKTSFSHQELPFLVVLTLLLINWIVCVCVFP